MDSEKKSPSNCASSDNRNDIRTSNNRKEFAANQQISNEKYPINNRLTAVEKYEFEWKDLSSLSEDPNLKQLRHLAVNGGLKGSKFRSVCWSLLLGVLTGRSQSWVTQRRCDRNRYKDLIEQFLNPRMAAEDDPLSQSEKSGWNQLFCDKELRTVITQDVVRTFPGVEFFRKSMIQEIMIKILFCYARVYPEMCYRQGMHEILAPILFVMHCDHRALEQVQEISASNVDIGLKEVLDPKYLEEDSYFIFTKIMLEIQPFYRIHDLHPNAAGYFPSSPQTASSNDSKNVSDLEVVTQLNMIRDKILAKADNQLHNHLLQLDIPLPLFGIRWLRLLFGREFQLFDLLLLWDTIFAEGNHFELTNYIVVAMLISIREEMLHSDYTTGLSYLMKYPTNIDVMLIIRHSLHMLAPDKYERPPNIFTLQSSSELQTNNKKLLLLNEKSATLPRNMHSKIAITGPNQQLQQHQPQSLNGSADMMRLPSTSQYTTAKYAQDYNQRHGNIAPYNNNVSKSDHIHERVNSLQNSTAKASIRIASHSQPQLNHDPGIVDGYLENSSEVLKLQLQNAHTVMTITRIKLMQYLAVFRKHIPGDSLHELHQTMDGIEELCELLKIKEKVPYNLPAPVEPALEANEAAASNNKKQTPQKKLLQHRQNQQLHSEEQTPKIVKVPTGSLPPLHLSPSNPRKQQISNAEAKREFVRTLQHEEQSFEVQAKRDGSLLHREEFNEQSSRKTSNELESAPLRTARYEIPDDSITRTAAKILGNRKELEMHEFLASRKSNIAAIDNDHTQKMPTIDPSGDRQLSPNSN